MVLITIVTGAYKPTYNWGASHCTYRRQVRKMMFMVYGHPSMGIQTFQGIVGHISPLYPHKKTTIIYHHVCCLISLNPTRLHFLLLKSIFSYLITPLYYSIHSIPSLKHQKSLRPVTPVRAKHKLQKVDVYYKTHLQSVKLWVKQS